jgi:hypothetical protein
VARSMADGGGCPRQYRIRRHSPPARSGGCAVPISRARGDRSGARVHEAAIPGALAATRSGTGWAAGIQGGRQAASASEGEGAARRIPGRDSACSWRCRRARPERDRPGLASDSGSIGRMSLGRMGEGSADRPTEPSGTACLHCHRKCGKLAMS